MDEILVNELSLEGQFQSMNDFIDNYCMEFINCLNYLKNVNYKVLKTYGLYSAKITDQESLNDVLKVRGDKQRKIKLLLLQFHPPYWEDEKKQEGEYYLGDRKVTDSSIAEAAARGKAVLSFYHEDYSDKELEVRKDGNIIMIFSISSLKALAEDLYKKGKIKINEYVRIKYSGTRLNFKRMEEEYGLEEFEKIEIEECLQNFEKFVNHSTWEEVYHDGGLRYKEYSPSNKEKDWFRGSNFSNKTIYKFRCGNPKRCFGFKEGEIFYVLRMERDHKISDNG